jgi:hypothetical protein
MVGAATQYERQTMKIHISNGNRKTGAISSVSTSPGFGCGKDVPCRNDCYARCNCPGALPNWADNARTVKSNPDAYFSAVRDYIGHNNPRFFRWHISGDFVDQSYLDNVKSIARDCPSTRFLAFTKRHDLRFAGLPENLSVVFSMWPGWRPNMTRVWRLPKAFMQDGNETRIPANAIECPGNCESCGMCWNLPKLGVDVVFHKH